MNERIQELKHQPSLWSLTMKQSKGWNWCKHCHRNPHRNGHTPFCPATGVEP